MTITPEDKELLASHIKEIAKILYKNAQPATIETVDSVESVLSSIEEVYSSLPYVAQTQLEEAIINLQQSGDSNENNQEGEILAQLSDVANYLNILAGDLAAFGPYCHDHIHLENEIDIQTQIKNVFVTIKTLQDKLFCLREGYIREQMASLSPLAEGSSLKLHIGAGSTPLQSWLNIDVYPSQLALDVRWGLPFDDGTTDYVFMSHILEHLYYPNEAFNVIKEIHRVLKVNGVVRIVVPDIEKCIHAYVEKDELFFKSRRKIWPWSPVTRTRLEGFLTYAGAGPNPGIFLHAHKFGYDFETLSMLLREAGFRQIEKSEYMKSHYPELSVDFASEVAGTKYGNQYYSLFVEGLK